LTKPFGVDELHARVRTAMRHRLQERGERPIFRSGDLAVDLVRRMVSVRAEEIRLSPREYEILRLLVTHAGKVLTHQFLMHEVCGVVRRYRYPISPNLYSLAAAEDRARPAAAMAHPNRDRRRISPARAGLKESPPHLVAALRGSVNARVAAARSRQADGFRS